MTNFIIVTFISTLLITEWFLLITRKPRKYNTTRNVGSDTISNKSCANLNCINDFCQCENCTS